MLRETTMGFVGGGQMCEAIAAGALAGGLSAQKIHITDVNEARLEQLAQKYGFATALNDEAGGGVARVWQDCDMIVLALKPQYAGGVLEALGKLSAQSPRLVVSIMGGVTLETLQSALPQSRVVRVMPNTPMLVGKGVAGIAPGPSATPEDTALVQQLFSLVGRSYVVSEALIDPLTGVSGCGPAFAYLMIEAMADGGVEEGLPRQMAIELAAGALLGAAEMVLQTGEHPGRLKDNVTSPGGGTIVGVHALESAGFRAAAMDAVVQSVRRMRRLGEG